MIISEEVIRSIELSEAKRVESSARAFGGDVLLPISGGVASFCGEGNVATQCVGVGLSGPIEHLEFDSILKHYQGRCTQFEFKLSPLAPLDLRSWVVQRSVSIPEFESLLVQDLSSFVPTPIEADFRLIDKPEALAYATRSAFRFCGDQHPPGLIELVAAGCTGEDVRSFEVYIDEQPVAGCALGFACGVAWLSGAAVLPGFRGRGLHKAMQAYRMALAKQMGYHLVCQGALPGSISQQNAQKSGFSIAFTRPTFMVSTSA